jgi:alpha-L-rhamnosidase
MEIYDIQINHINKPVGFYMPENPVISYKVSGAQGVKQKSVRISVYDEAAPATTIYESGLMYDSQAVYEMPVKLKPCTRYFVKLRIESDIGEQASAQTYFETGKSTEPWKAEWITVGAEIKDEAVPVLGQVFTVSEEISQARMYIASAGLFRVELMTVRSEMNI